MAAAMVRLLQDPTERLAMATAANLRAEEEFSSAHMAATYIRLYENILARQTSVRLERREVFAAHPTH